MRSTVQYIEELSVFFIKLWFKLEETDTIKVSNQNCVCVYVWVCVHVRLILCLVRAFSVLYGCHMAAIN